MTVDSARRLIELTATMALVIVVTAAPASASSPHFKHGGAPQCRDSGTALECLGEIAGLGNDDIRFVIDADAFGSFACVNPSSKREPAGQNKVYFPVFDETIIDAANVKNGSLRFEISAPNGAPSATPQEAGCPGGNWSTRLVDLEFSNISLTIEQPPGTPIFTCTRSGPLGSQFSTVSCTAG